MEIGYHGDAGGPLPGFSPNLPERRIQGTGVLGGGAQQSNQAAAMQALGINAAKEPSPVERELRQLETNVKRLYGEIDRLASQLVPVVVPQLEAKSASQAEQIGVATSPLERSILAANVSLTKLAVQVAQLRGSLSI